ncbi:hypothetical protein B0H63DRAFT_502456 [Podospora didyma]|uniref:Uncharacterized protein n=1 Tax=Podospora didyma TaxID=330526 RepID=A0AAE0KKK4_9PEZI|nr:hypothetical protein B0H63DRAFT_502456 [Podospora didyma]
MVRNPGHAQWQAPSLEQKLAERLDRSFESLKNTMEDIGDMTAALENGLRCFAPLQEEQEKDEELRTKSPKQAMRKLRKRIKIAFEMGQFERQIASLEKANDRLRRLRQQVNELQKPQHSTEITSKRPKIGGQLPTEFKAFGAIQRASEALYEALSIAWSTQLPCPRHSVRLFLNAKAETDVQMEIAILCPEDPTAQQAIELVKSKLIRLEVRSRTMAAHALLTPEPDVSEVRPPGENEPKKRRKVQFACFSGSGAEEDTAKQLPDLDNTGKSTPRLTSVTLLVDLQLSGHFCPELTRRSMDCSSLPHKTENCLGHLDSCLQENFRHWFYPPPDMQGFPNFSQDDLVLVEDVLKQPVYNRLSVVSQLRLAFQIASAVLKFNSTPWLNELWSVRDLAFFRQSNDLTQSLQTVHFSADLIHGGNGQTDHLMDADSPVSMTRSLIEGAQRRHGIRNTTLYSLGVAMLAIGRWEQVDPNDVEGVRELASQTCFLGPRYQELTEKILDCDFGYGKDLKKPRLKEAIYETVILELESMIASLDLAGG